MLLGQQAGYTKYHTSYDCGIVGPESTGKKWLAIRKNFKTWREKCYKHYYGTTKKGFVALSPYQIDVEKYVKSLQKDRD